jgi:hypothetical protein
MPLEVMSSRRDGNIKELEFGERCNSVLICAVGVFYESGKNKHFGREV